MRFTHMLLVGALLLLAATATATIFGAVRGIVHDPQHRPVQGAMVMLKAKSSEWSKTANTDANGNFEFNAVPLGEYSVTRGESRICSGSTECSRQFRLRTRRSLPLKPGRRATKR